MLVSDTMIFLCNGVGIGFDYLVHVAIEWEKKVMPKIFKKSVYLTT